jgi:3-oxoacyl-[acyl-carrier protein] reductase
MTGLLDGRVAIVTGGGRGIGLCLVEQLAREGAKILINDLDEEPAQAAAEVARAAGGVATTLVGSVTAPDFPERCVATALEAFSDVHIIVNNAGFVWNGSIHKQTDEQWDAMQDVHLKAPFRLLRAVQPVLKERVMQERAAGTRIVRKVVNVMSVAATGGSAGQVGYSSAKAGLYGLTRSLAKEWGSLDVNVNAVAFGLIDTRLTSVSAERQSIDIGGRAMPVGFTPAAVERILPSIALGRAGTPYEAAGAIMLMCLPQSDYVTGQVLRADGGLSN